MRNFLQNCCRKKFFCRYLQSQSEPNGCRQEPEGSQGGGRDSKSPEGRISSAVEHFTRNEGVPSSNLGFGSQKEATKMKLFVASFFRYRSSPLPKNHSPPCPPEATFRFGPTPRRPTACKNGSDEFCTHAPIRRQSAAEIKRRDAQSRRQAKVWSGPWPGFGQYGPEDPFGLSTQCSDKSPKYFEMCPHLTTFAP